MLTRFMLKSCVDDDCSVWVPGHMKNHFSNNISRPENVYRIISKVTDPNQVL